MVDFLVAYQPIATKEEGGQKKVWVDDSDAQEIFRQILDELKRMNIHFQAITDEEIEGGDLR